MDKSQHSGGEWPTGVAPSAASAVCAASDGIPQRCYAGATGCEQPEAPSPVAPGHFSRRIGTSGSSATRALHLDSLTHSLNFEGRVKRSDEAIAMLVNSALEQEKARISRELHDDIVQTLFALKLDCAWLSTNLIRDPATSMAKLKAMLTAIEGSSTSVRRIAAGLRPQPLEAGFVAAAEGLARRFEESTGTACRLNVPRDLQVKDPCASAAFRVIQEALNNVRKHASAGSVEISVGVAGGRLHLCVSDDGKGFSMADAKRQDAMGLNGLRERVELLQGELQVSSVPGAGTTLVARIPLQPLPERRTPTSPPMTAQAAHGLQ
jgi:signal transduction histidine kinase